MQYSVIGKRVSSFGALEKATGEAVYLPDVKLPGMLYGKILRSPYPHARVLHIDTEKAERLKGIRGVVMARDTPMIRFCIIPQLANKPPLAVDKVRFTGDEIAAVANAIDDAVGIRVRELPITPGKILRHLRNQKE